MKSENKNRKINFVPVSINYEKVIEAHNFPLELIDNNNYNTR